MDNTPFICSVDVLSWLYNDKYLSYKNKMDMDYYNMDIYYKHPVSIYTLDVPILMDYKFYKDEDYDNLKKIGIINE